MEAAARRGREHDESSWNHDRASLVGDTGDSCGRDEYGADQGPLGNEGLPGGGGDTASWDRSVHPHPPAELLDQTRAAERFANVVPREQARWLFLYVGLVFVAALAVFAPSLADLPEIVRAGDPEFWLIVVLALVVDARPFAAPGQAPVATVFPSIAFSFALLLGWGLAPAVLMQALAVVVSSVRLRRAPWRVLFNASQYALALAAADLVLRLAGVQRLTEDNPAAHTGTLGVLAILVAGAAWFMVHDLLTSTAVWLRFGGRWMSTTVTAPLRHEALSILSLLALGPLVVAAGNVSTALVPLILVPLFTVSELAQATAEEQRRSRRDDLTALPNRKALHTEIRQQVRAYTRRSVRVRRDRDDPGRERRMALLLLDIDQFRRVNDALGHAVGDQLLGAVAQRLRDAVGADGFVARLGGDEFAILAPRLTDFDAAGVLARRVADALAAPVTLEGLPLDVTASIGVAVHPDHGTDNTTLLRHAEVAMYDAKSRAARYAVYTQESDQNSVERLELLADLRRALEANPDELRLFYQPQIEMATGHVVGLEALLRWTHPGRGFVSPDVLIKVAEHTAVMRLITSHVLDEAIAQLAKWRAQGLMLRTSINVSVRDLAHPELVDELAALLADRGVSPNQVQLEITEGALMADPRRVLVTLHRLDKLGVALSLDDFGTGYSSLQHLRRLPLAEVKIDRSFVMGMTTDPDDAAVVRSIIDLARALGLRVVAEGVEDDQTRRLLTASGCDVGQGWLFARPMPADALATWLARYRPVTRLDPQD
jgi:diguanylate cyclase (GGDEF)-like protein